MANFGRKIAFVRAAHKLVRRANGADHFSRGRQQRNNTLLWHELRTFLLGKQESWNWERENAGGKERESLTRSKSKYQVAGIMQQALGSARALACIQSAPSPIGSRRDASSASASPAPREMFTIAFFHPRLSAAICG
jgi:hypothetical protein